MKSFLLFLIVTLFCVGCTSERMKEEASTFFTAAPQPLPAQQVATLPVGSKAPDFTLPGTDARYWSLSDFKDASVLVVVFTCNHCPTAQAYEERIKQIVNDYSHKGVALVAISPNSPLGLLYEELGYSDLNDDYDEMIIRYNDKSFNFPYLYDGDNEAVSLAYGPVATPHVFVFDKDRILKYQGRIDASEKPGTGQAEDLRAAIDALLNGEDPAVSSTKTFGCSTKWAWKTELKEKINTEWASKEVSLHDADKEVVKDLVKNEDSQKLRLINAWATWCGPCILEYPEFVNIQRMFGARDFEFVSLSLDKVEKKSKALEFLKKSQSALDNYIFTGKDVYELIEIVDPEWNGALPYTILVEPGGKVVWRHQGTVDFYRLKKEIVEHPMIGRYY